MISQQEWHTNHGSEGYTTAWVGISSLLTFQQRYTSREAANTVVCLPEMLRTLMEVLSTLERTAPDEAKKVKELLKKAGQL